MTGTIEQRLDAAIVALVSRGAIVVPPYPAAAQRLNALVAQENFSLLEMAKIIETDQRLAADTMQCANSSAFNPAGDEITSLNTAIVRLGAKTVVRIALTSGLAGYICRPGPFTPLRQRAWRQALVGALVCQELAKTHSRNIFVGEAFLCGLLHDIGESISLSCIETILDTWPDFEPQSYVFWDIILQRYHVEVGLVVAAQWSLPEQIQVAISAHHGGYVDEEFASMVEAVKVADRVAQLLESKPRVTSEDLAVVEGLLDDECERVARALVGLPEIIASLIPDDKPLSKARPSRSRAARVGPPPSSRRSTATRKSTGARARRKSFVMATPRVAVAPDTDGSKYLFDAQNLLRGKTQRYRALALTESELTVIGSKPLTENSLVCMRLEVAALLPLTVWMKVRWCCPAEGGKRHRAAVMPFVLDGPDFDRWKALVKQFADAGC